MNSFLDRLNLRPQERRLVVGVLVIVFVVVNLWFVWPHAGDLKIARAFFSVIGDAERERQALDGLQQARGFLRHQMAQRMRMHSPPDLEFRRDKGFERADRISRLLDKISKESAPEGEIGVAETTAPATVPADADVLPEDEASAVPVKPVKRPARSKRE